MKANEEGFCYPHIDTLKCVNCGRCEGVCPIGKVNEQPSFKVYAAVAKNHKVLEAASSGGVFGEIALWVLKKHGVVYGCAFTDGLKATHVRIDTLESLPVLYGSKYVQSDTNGTFKSVREDLSRGKWVLYSGTPCQIAGLKSFLDGMYDRLVLVDIVCHGVPSQSYFDKYIKWLEDSTHTRIKEFRFRSKSNHGWSLAGDYTAVDQYSSVKKYKLFYFDHYYYYYFLEGSIYRECCYNCNYANLNRVSDFTLGDLWGAESLKLPFDIKNGCSVVLANTEKARKIVGELNIEKTLIKIETAVMYNEQLDHPSNNHPDRHSRLEDFKKYSGYELQKYFVSQRRLDRLKGRIKYLIPTFAVRHINKIRFKNGS